MESSELITERLGCCEGTVKTDKYRQPMFQWLSQAQFYASCFSVRGLKGELWKIGFPRLEMGRAKNERVKGVWDSN